MKEENIQLHDLNFTSFLSEETVQQRVTELGQELHGRFADKNPVFLVMLKGAFVFAADLIRFFDAKC